MQYAILIRVAHGIRGGKNGHRRAYAFLASLGIVQGTLHMTAARHALFIYIDRQLVSAHEIVILPGSRISRVRRDAFVVVKFSAIAYDIDGTLDFREGSSAVGLFLVVIRRGGLAATVRDVVLKIRVHLYCFAASP